MGDFTRYASVSTDFGAGVAGGTGVIGPVGPALGGIGTAGGAGQTSSNRWMQTT